MGRPAYPANQLSIGTINDLSAILFCKNPCRFNTQLYNDKIEESLIEKDKEKFMKYTSLLKDL